MERPQTLELLELLWWALLTLARKLQLQWVGREYWLREDGREARRPPVH